MECGGSTPPFHNSTPPLLPHGRRPPTAFAPLKWHRQSYLCVAHDFQRRRARDDNLAATNWDCTDLSPPFPLNAAFLANAALCLVVYSDASGPISSKTGWYVTFVLFWPILCELIWLLR